MFQIFSCVLLGFISFYKLKLVSFKSKNLLYHYFDFFLVYAYTVTSRLFTHIVSTEKMRKYLRDHKDLRGANYTYYISCFLILLLLKVDMGLFHF